MAPDRRTFLTAAATTGLAGATALGAQEEDISRLGRTPHTRFAVNVEMWWTRLPFLQRLEQAARHGFPAVEFWPWRNKDLPAIRRECERLNLEVAQFTAWGFSPGLNNPDNHDAFVAEVRAGCDAARQLDCRLMTVVAGDDVPGMTQAEMHRHVIAGLRRAAPICERAGVTMILEPMNIRVDHKGHCLYGSEPAIGIVQAVGSPALRINWDLYHMHITEGDLCGHLQEGIGQIGYVQLADHPGRNEPGTGEVHYPRVLQELHGLGYRGFVGLECRPKGSELDAARAVHRADQW